MSYDRETARRMLQYSNLMTGGVGLYCDVFVAIGLKNAKLNATILHRWIGVLFEPPFGGRRGNVLTPSIARWKARGRLPVRYNLTFFAISYG